MIQNDRFSLTGEFSGPNIMVVLRIIQIQENFYEQ